MKINKILANFDIIIFTVLHYITLYGVTVVLCKGGNYRQFCITCFERFSNSNILSRKRDPLLCAKGETIANLLLHLLDIL